MSIDQLAARFFSERKNPRECAHRAARKLREEGYVDTRAAMVRQMSLCEPLLRWSPEDNPPQLGKLAWANQKRWRAQVPRKTVCLTSTDKARAQFGGHCREPRPRELEHDVAVAELYLQLQKLSPQVAGTWQHEDALPAQDSLRPDAILERDNQTIAIDLLGSSYTKAKLERLWEHYQQTQLELW